MALLLDPSCIELGFGAVMLLFMAKCQLPSSHSDHFQNLGLPKEELYIDRESPLYDRFNSLSTLTSCRTYNESCLAYQVPIEIRLPQGKALIIL